MDGFGDDGSEILDDIDNHTIIVDDRVIIVESTWGGESRTPANFEMTPYTAEAVTVLEVEDGLITRSNIYVDLDDIFG